jgi:hypothetical protein
MLSFCLSTGGADLDFAYARHRCGGTLIILYPIS